MLRSSLIAVGAALVCGVASAQNQMNASRLYPIHGNIRDAGIYDMRTGRWHSHSQAGQLGAAQQTIYNNTCLEGFGGPPPAFFYFGIHEACENWYDAGRIPASGPPGSGPDNATNTWIFGYCTGAAGQPTTPIDIDWGVNDTNAAANAAQCAGAVPAGTPEIVGFSSAAAGFPLPGSTNPTVNATCWIVTFTSGTASACQHSGATAGTDLFTWRSTFNNTIVQTSGPTGTFALQGNPLSGDPLNQTSTGAGPGSGTYNIPPGTDFTGASCGSGLDNGDLFWINVNGVAPGGVVTGFCSTQAAASTGCYFFGGYPANPPGSFYFQIDANGGCGCTGNVTTYCTAKTASNGCTPSIASTGAPSASAGSGFMVTTSHVISNKNGVHFYSTNGIQGVPFQGGYLCMHQPIHRLPVQNSGSAGTACGTASNSGSLVSDFNVKIFSGTDPNLVAGANVAIQGWYRDPASPSTTGLGNAQSFTICP
jgi:hypothetical protein